MADDNLVERYFEFTLPIWVIVQSEAARTLGATAAVLTLVGEEGDIDLPLFQSEATAQTFLSGRSLAGHEVTCIEDETDLRIILEVFRNRNGQYVRIDDTPDDAPGKFCPTVESFLSMLRK